jgi:hypothetical protein
MLDRLREDYAESLIDMAHHLGNWADDSPPWYDWDKHRFRARWMGTKNVGSEGCKLEGANGNSMFRYLILAEQAYLLTGQQRYLDLMIDYADQWCELIRQYENDPAGIPAWFGADWEPMDTNRKLPITFINGGMLAVLLDLYRIVGEKEYARCGGVLMERATESHLTTDPEDGTAARFCALTASTLAHYRQVTGDRDLDEYVISLIEESPAECLPESVEFRPTKPFSAELNWACETAGSEGKVTKCPAAVHALAWQISGEESHLETALQLAARRFEIVRPLGAEGRFHGCARGNTRTVIDEDILPVLHAAAMGLHGMCFDGNAHIQPAVAYRGPRGGMGLPENAAGIVRKTADGTQIKLFNCGERPVTMLVADLSDVPSPIVSDEVRSRSPLAFPWAEQRRLFYVCQRGAVVS